MYSLDDTIAAISTPLGEGGIGLVRISGPEAGRILKALFNPARGNGEIRPFTLRHGWVVDPATGERVDEALAAFMPAPGTYTRQDVAEVNGHGGLAPLRRVLELALRHGARAAEPGEFTLRAFVNGRIDLAQAEAVLEVVRARTDAGLRLAVTQLEGRLSGEVRRARQTALSALAYLEATIDFTEDEIPPEDPRERLGEARGIVARLLQDADKGIVVRQGARVAIVGRPNVGKSSLLNALLRADRAIITPIPGTTRDTLEETANLRGVPVVLVDTAGISDGGADPIVRLGIERSRRALTEADLALLVVDGSEALQPDDWQIAQMLEGRAVLVVVNKSDLGQVADLAQFADGALRVSISALTGDGLDHLEEAVHQAVLGAGANGAPLVASLRHKQVLEAARWSLEHALGTLAAGLPADLVCIDVRGVVDALGEITGQTASEELVQAIFSRFCVGK